MSAARRLDLWTVVLVFAWAVIAALLLYPLSTVLRASLIDAKGQLSLANYAAVLGDPVYHRVIVNTILVGVLAWQAVVTHETRRDLVGQVVAVGTQEDGGPPASARLLALVCNTGNDPVELDRVAVLGSGDGVSLVAASVGTVSRAGDQGSGGVTSSSPQPLAGFELEGSCAGPESDGAGAITIDLGLRDTAALPGALRMHYETGRGAGELELELAGVEGRPACPPLEQ